jgi:amidase
MLRHPMASVTRRRFMKTVAVLPAAPFVSRLGVLRGTADFDPDFASAFEGGRAVRLGRVSSRELTEHVFQRIRDHNPKINAFITLLEEDAYRRATQADEELARGKNRGPLHGVPVVIKDSFETAGTRTTSGARQFENHIPDRDAVAVSRLRRSGAIVIGKTNLPEFAGDWQSHNEIVGTTRNPWDATRTPGGSTGGGAAALAAGLGFLELGSDIGGSIRIPSHFCGVYGLKPTLNVVPMRGHIPPPPGERGAVSDLGVAGPMARAATDLRLALEILGGPDPEETVAYRWSLPAPRRAGLGDYRIGYVLDHPLCPVGPEILSVLSDVVDSLGRAGARLREGWPPDYDAHLAYDVYRRLMYPYFPLSEEQMVWIRREKDGPLRDYARIYLELETYTHDEWLRQTSLRIKQRGLWRKYFEDVDVFLLPASFLPAFPHLHEGTFLDRKLETLAGPRVYLDMLFWGTFATLSGCPAVAAPVGRTSAGLPVGLQIMGPFLEDATPIDVAGRLADLVGGFEAPSGYRG